MPTYPTPSGGTSDLLRELLAATGGGSSTVAVPQGVAALIVVKATHGTLAQITITTAGTSSIAIYDNATAASGTVLFATPAVSALGTIYKINATAANGITVAAQTSTTPAFTLSYY